MMLQVPARPVVLRVEAGMKMTTAKAILAAVGAAPGQTMERLMELLMELLMAKLPTLAIAGTREPLTPMLLEALGEPTPLNQLLRLRGNWQSATAGSFLSEQFEGYN